TGAALSLITQPELFENDVLATQLSEAVISTKVTGAIESTSPRSRRTAPKEPSLATAAATLSSRLHTEATPLTDAERALMQQWLATRADAPSVGPARTRRPRGPP